MQINSVNPVSFKGLIVIKGLENSNSNHLLIHKTTREEDKYLKGLADMAAPNGVIGQKINSQNAKTFVSAVQEIIGKPINMKSQLTRMTNGYKEHVNLFSEDAKSDIDIIF